MVSVRGFFDVLFTPIARRLGGVDPNTLTFISLACGLAAGGAFAMAGSSRWYYVAAGLLVALSGAADALDGLVARRFNRVSVGGDFLDHFGDRIVEVFILGGIALSPGAGLTTGLVVIVLTLLHSYAGAQMEATFRIRGHEGGGKAEQFVGLVVFAGVLAIVPDGSLQIGTYSIALASLFFWVLGTLTAVALVHRLIRARTLARERTSGSPPQV